MSALGISVDLDGLIHQVKELRERAITEREAAYVFSVSDNWQGAADYLADALESLREAEQWVERSVVWEEENG